MAERTVEVAVDSGSRGVGLMGERRVEGGSQLGGREGGMDVEEWVAGFGDVVTMEIACF